MEKLIDNRSQIIHDVIDFYQLQPGVKPVHIEKIEEYLILIDSFFREAILELLLCDKSVDLFDVLNSYINSITEEYEKIFPEEDLGIYLIEIFDKNLNELQICEALQRFNYNNRFRIHQHLQNLEENIFEDEFDQLLQLAIQQLICSINSEIFIKVDDLI